MSIAKLAARLKVAGAHRMSLQLSQQVPGTPFAIRGGESKEERLPGMRRWVDRETLEDAMQSYADGVPEEQFVDEVRNEGLGRSVGMGALLGAPAGYTLFNGRVGELPMLQNANARLGGHGPLAAMLLGSLAGAGTGYLTHKLTSNRRAEDAAEAYAGARMDALRNPRPPTALPQGRRDEGSAASVPPNLLATAPAVA